MTSSLVWEFDLTPGCWFATPHQLLKFGVLSQPLQVYIHTTPVFLLTLMQQWLYVVVDSCVFLEALPPRPGTLSQDGVSRWSHCQQFFSNPTKLAGVKLQQKSQPVMIYISKFWRIEFKARADLLNTLRGDLGHLSANFGLRVEVEVRLPDRSCGWFPHLKHQRKHGLIHPKTTAHFLNWCTVWKSNCPLVVVRATLPCSLGA